MFTSKQHYIELCNIIRHRIFNNNNKIMKDIVLLLLLHTLLARLGNAQRSILDLPQHHESCSREQSRTARRLVQTHILLPASAASVPMSSDCPFQPNLDRYREHEIHGKTKTYRGHWQCPYSGKVFKTERYLDFHLQRFWSQKNGVNASECLASWCDVLGCEDSSTNKRPLTGTKTNEERHLEHKCRAVLHSCFPPTSGVSARHLQDQIFETVCSKSIRSEKVRRKLKQQHHAQHMSAFTVLWYILVIVTTLVTAVFYICYYLQRVDGQVDLDLVCRQRAKKGTKFF